ncbi:MAG: ABC transporter ATP-binding protein, partial [Clostridia bacterium]
DIDKVQNDYIFLAGLQMLGVAFISMSAAVLIMLLSSRVAAKLGKTLRDKVFQKVLGFSTKEFREFSTASLITRSTNDIQQIQMLLTMLFRVVVYAPIIGIGGLLHVIRTSDSSMAWIIGLAIVAVIVIVLILFIVAMPKFKKLQDLIDKINMVAREILTGIPVIRAFNTQKREEERFDKANTDLMKTNVFVNRAMSMMMPALMFIMNSVMILIIWVGGHNVDQGIMQVGDMMAFIQYTMQIIMSFLMISMISIMLPRASVSANRINEVLETKPSIKDKDKKELKEFDENKKGLVEFKNVSFRYPDADTEILTDIDFVARPGQTTAIIGSTGSGKSTIVNLIPRFYDVTGGELLVDGVNIKDVPQKELRKRIGFVPQKGILFSGTIESNIKYGDETMSDEQMEKAASIAQATEFIQAKEEKYISPIAQGGSNVSGGQKQRLSIARALAIDPEIFVFDDSFSALDLKTDKALREALSQQTENKTVIIVAQRISTIMNAEQIIVLEEGKIVGKGTHEELMENCDTYKQIALSQLSEEELKQNGKEEN